MLNEHGLSHYYVIDHLIQDRLSVSRAHWAQTDALGKLLSTAGVRYSYPASGTTDVEHTLYEAVVAVRTNAVTYLHRDHLGIDGKTG